MSDHHHHHHHRPQRISVPPRNANPTAVTTAASSRPYPLYPYSSSTPIPTPSKQRLPSISSINTRSNNKSSFSFLFLILFSLRSLYSLLPFLRSSPSFSLFPFSFLVSLLSFLLTFAFSFFTFASWKDPFQNAQKQQRPIFSLNLITQSQHRLLFTKSILLAVVFLLRFQALRYCGTAATILAELSGNVAARFVAGGRNQNFNDPDRSRSSKVRGFSALFVGLFLLSISWDRVDCFPFSSSNVLNRGVLSLFSGGNCIRVLPMLLPFLSGFLGCYERASMNWGTIRQLGRKRVRLISLFFTTVVLFFPAVVSFFMFEASGDGVSIGNIGWPLANTVVFGVLLSENFSDEKLASSKDFHREFLTIFVCTLVLELFYFPELSLWGLLFCGFLLWISVRELDPVSSSYQELGVDSSETFSLMIMKSIRHILSERKSRKIALFLLINTAYMVVEFVAGFMSNSLGLISDACHMLFDCAALAIGLYASYISRLPANNHFNYGRGRFEVLSGYVNAVFLVLLGALIVLESFERILDPQEISTNSLLSVSIGGLVVNLVGLVFFHEEHHHAHGGSGSCSHSLQHSQSHHHFHDHSVHDHKVHGAHHNHILVSHESHEHAFDGHDHHFHDHEHHDYQNNNFHTHKDSSSGNYETGRIECHDNMHLDNHHDHHDQGCQHDHHDHHHHPESNVHRSRPISSPRSSHNHPSEGHINANSHAQEGSHNDYQRSVHIHAHESDLHRESSLGSGQHLPEPSTKGKLLEKPQKHHHHHIDHNMEGIFLHVLADTMGSVGVVISTLLIKYKGWLVADPACSIFISGLIILSVIPLLRNSAEILLQRIPKAHEQDLRAALQDVVGISGIHGIQNLHVWSLTNTDVVGTLHLQVSPEIEEADAKAKVQHLLHNAGIKDLTMQVEYVNTS